MQEALSNSDDSGLLSLFLDPEEGNEPRAAVAYGDVDAADLVVTLTHGINNDLLKFDAWAEAAEYLREDLMSELERRGYDPADGRERVATVTWFGYDSKGMGEVGETAHADAGGARYARFMESIQHTNPEAEASGWFHSYGTTMGAQGVSRMDSPIDQVYALGSAGWTEDAADSLGSRDIELLAAHASADRVAPLGRGALVQSTHRVNPGELDYVTEVGADGGYVDFGVGRDGTGRIEYGEATDGHNSHEETAQTRVAYGGRAHWQVDSGGYLQRNAQAYYEGMDRAADLLLETA